MTCSDESMFGVWRLKHKSIGLGHRDSL